MRTFSRMDGCLLEGNQGTLQRISMEFNFTHKYVVYITILIVSMTYKRVVFVEENKFRNIFT